MLARCSVTFQRTKTWKESPERDSAASRPIAVAGT